MQLMLSVPAERLAPHRGRWLALRLFNTGPALEVTVQLPSNTSLWPTAECRHWLPAGASQLTVFVNAALAGLRLCAPEGQSLRLEGLTSIAPPGRGTGVRPLMHTLARLQRLKVQRLLHIALLDEAETPLQSTGEDPQIWFEGITRPGRYRLAVTLPYEGPAALPHLYYLTGKGMGEEHSMQLKGQGKSMFMAEFEARQKSRYLRLDPFGREGRFDIHELSCMPVLGNKAVPWHTRLRAFCERLVGLWSLRSIRPLAALTQVSHFDDGRVSYLATDSDPQFALHGRVPAGWYMWELGLNLASSRSTAQIYWDEGLGLSEERSATLQLRSGLTGKRLLYLPRSSQLRFDPVTHPGQLQITCFRLRRVSPAFAVQRMLAKLTRNHPRYRQASVVQATTAEARWADYQSLFLHGQALIGYAEWISSVETRQLKTATQQQVEREGWANPPVFSIVLPVYNTPLPLLRQCLDSVLAQSYPHWQLCIANDASTTPGLAALLDGYAAGDARIAVTHRPVNGHICAASNSALALATGEWIVLLDHDDRLPAHALHSVAAGLQAAPDAQLVYSDEDKLDESGERTEPFFKPDFSRDQLHSQNYFSHLGCYRRSLVEAVGGFREGYEGSQDYDLVLRCIERVSDAEVLHIPQVLYHWRKVAGSTAAGHAEKDYASSAGLRALQDHLARTRPGTQVSERIPGIYRAQAPLPQPPPLVSLIIPTRDKLELLRACVESILGLTDYPAIELLVVDNQSTEPATLAYFEQLKGRAGVRVLPYHAPFNFSAMNNLAAAEARGTVLGLINNDIEVIHPEWLAEMVSQVMRPEIGCVGAKLLYPNGSIQHAGVVCGLGGVANHSHRHFPKDSPGYFGRLWTVHNLSAVTAAALLVRREVFEQVGGLDAQNLLVAFNDVDFCLKVQAAGYLNLFTPYAELVHHESVSRGAEDSPEKKHRFEHEVGTMLARWAPQLQSDRYYNPNLTRAREDFSLSDAGTDYAAPP